MTSLTTLDEPSGRHVDVAGTSVHVQVVGDGPPLVMIHGGGPGASGWSNFKQNVPTLARSHLVVLVDLPGYGRSAPARLGDGETMFQFYARTVDELLAELGHDSADFVGNSLGASTAFRLALDNPGRVRRMVLMGPGGAALPVFSPGAKMAAALGRTAAELTRAPGDETMAAFLRTMVYDHATVTPEVVTERLDSFLRAEAERAPLLEAWEAAGGGRVPFDPRDFEIWRECERVQQETLLLWGRDDQINPLDGALYPLSHMPNAELHVFTRCGHWAQVEHTAEFDAIVLEFLSRGQDPATGPADGTGVS